MISRSDRFKQAISRLDPSGDPAKALKDGLYVEEPGQSFAERTLARLELRPGSSHLLVGPSGTGKTTQLRLLNHNLSARSDMTPLFVDVTATKLDLQRPGGLIEHLEPLVKRIIVDENGGDNLASRIAWAAFVSTIPQKSSVELLPHLAQRARKLVLIIDSLDNVPIEVFIALCTQDLATIKQYLAVVIVGSPAMTYGPGREFVAGFDYLSHQPIYNPGLGGTMQAFFTRLIGQRVEDDLMPQESCVPLVDASGGVPRDLLALAQFALEETYVAGYNCVEPDDVTRAIDKFAQKHITGLDSNDRARLHRLHKTGAFAPTGSRDIDLLVTRRILQYTAPSGARTFAVHPALVPLIAPIDPLESL